jgi:hypothetical protein
MMPDCLGAGEMGQVWYASWWYGQNEVRCSLSYKRCAKR